MKNSDIKIGKRYSATKPSENWGNIDGWDVAFNESLLRVEVLPKPDNCYDDEGLVDLPEHLNSPEWFWIKNIETGREHWINTEVYKFKELYYEIGK